MTEAVRRRRVNHFLQEVRSRAEGMTNKDFGEMYRVAVEDIALRGDSTLFDFMRELERPPVDIETFLDSPEFFGSTDMELWPEVRASIIEMHKDWWRGAAGGAFFSATLAGATGTGKTSIGQVHIAYTTYLLSCMKNPQKWFSLPSATSIVIAIIAHKPHIMKKVVYAPLRKMMESMPYFQKYMMPDKLIDSEMNFPEKNIRIIPAGGDQDSVLGEAVICAVVDEINFMNIVQRSKKVEASGGRAGVYNQADVTYTTVTRRKRGRFTRPGPIIGMVVASSSTRYAGDYTDKLMASARAGTVKNMYVYCKKQYDVVPSTRFSGVTFPLLVGNDVQGDTRVLEEHEIATLPAGSRIEQVPIEYIDDFRTDPYGSLRDIMGISSSVISPFYRTRNKIQAMFVRGYEDGLESILEKDNVELGIDGFLVVRKGVFCANPSRPRYVHIDLSLTQDRCGIAMVRFDGLVTVGRGNGMSEVLPKATVEMAATITPDANNEIDIAQVRAFVQSLKTRYGYKIRGVSYDGFQSRESIQAWRKSGMRASVISMDKTDVPHKQMQSAIYDDRLDCYPQEVLEEELMSLEYDTKQKRVDHPIGGYKDVSDAVAGAYTNMLERRSTWEGSDVLDGHDLDMEGRLMEDDRLNDLDDRR